jgi:kinesin family protein 20
MPEIKRKGDKPRRMPLKIAEDRGGCVYIRGLREILVSNADEAYQLLIIGRENLQFAATRLNHHSSRSHCIFTIKVIRVADKVSIIIVVVPYIKKLF